jgi:hypothetical protein
MVNKTLKAVTKQLGETFGKSYHYYVETVEQGLTKPCFTIDVLIPTMRSKSPILYDRTIPMVLHYFSDSKNTKQDCYEKAEKIAESLEYLPFEGTFLRGEDITWNINDDVLQLFITYKYTTKKVKPEEDVMETVEDTVVKA